MDNARKPDESDFPFWKEFSQTCTAGLPSRVSFKEIDADLLGAIPRLLGEEDGEGNTKFEIDRIYFVDRDGKFLELDRLDASRKTAGTVGEQMARRPDVAYVVRRKHNYANSQFRGNFPEMEITICMAGDADGQSPDKR